MSKQAKENCKQVLISKTAHKAAANPLFCSLRQIDVQIHPLGKMLDYLEALRPNPSF